MWRSRWRASIVAMTFNRRPPTCLALAIAAAAAVALPSAAGAAKAKPKPKPKSQTAAVGNWAGSATYTSPADSKAPGIEYKSSIVLSTAKDGKGVVRLSGFIATVRTYCLSGIRDIRIVKPEIRKGPKVSNDGSFGYTVQGVTVSGRLGRPNGNGSLTASAKSCDLKNGVWQATKRRY
jgi:hypothetical protein